MSLPTPIQTVEKLPTSTAIVTNKLVHVPHATEPSLSPPQSASVGWAKLPALGLNRFAGHRDNTLGEEILDIAKAESEPMVQPNGVADDFGRKPVVSIQSSPR